MHIREQINCCNLHKMFDFLISNFITTLSITIVFLTFIFYIKDLLHYYRLYTLGNKLNGPKAWPIIANGLEFLGRVEDFSSKLMCMIKIYPSPLRIWLGPKLFVVIKDPNDIEIAFTKNLEKGELYRFGKPWVGDGLITAPVNKWKKNRKLLLPTFHQQILNTFVEIFQEESIILVKKLETEVNKDFFDVFPYLSACSLNIICRTALGVNTQDGISNYCQCANRVLNIMSQREFKFWYHSDFVFNLMPIGKEHNRCIKQMHEFVDKAIKRKREEYQKTNNNVLIQESIKNEYFNMKRKPLLELLLDNTELTDEEIRDEVNTMTIAGNETIATTVSFCLMILGNHPEVQNILYNEISELFDNKNREVEISDLPKLEYLEMVLKETLRLFPAVPLIIRQVIKDFQLGSYTIPSGCDISLGIFHLHRDPKIWSVPELFNPERFRPEKALKRHPYSFMPFGVPPRNCIGAKYSYMLMKVIMANIIRKYEVISNKTLADIEVRLDITLKSIDGFLIKLISRNKNKTRQ